jgi:outer membrane protein assembly factor BamB
MAITLSTGRPLWVRDIGGYSGLAMLADRLIVSDPDGNVFALDRNNGSPLWKQDALARRWLTTPAVHGNFAVVGDVEGYLHWIRLEDGQLAGRTRLDKAPILGTPQVSYNGMLLALSSDGRLTAFPQPQ